MIKKQGFIEGVSRDGKRFKMGADWFSAFAASQMAGINSGDYVQFTYTEKPSPTGDVYRNVKGNVVKTTPPADAPMTAAGMLGKSGGIGPGKPYVDSRGFVQKEFPVPAFHPDRSIIRQNSLSHAASVMRDYGFDGGATGKTSEDYANRVIEIARLFEAYSAGDLDVAIVEAEMKLLTAKET